MLFLSLPFPPAMTNFWWVSPHVLQLAQIQSRAEPALQAPCHCHGVTLAIEGCRISPSTSWRQLQLPAQVKVGSMNPEQH